MPNYVQLFKSTDTGAPVMKGTAGALTDVLDACLVNGYATASVSSITRSGSTATATIASNTTLRTGDYVTFSGAGETEYNITAQITVNSGTSISYQVSGTPATPATGTLLYNKAGAQWEIAFTGTNKRAYRSPNVGSNRFYFRVDDSTAVGNVREGYLRGYETMSDIDTGTGPFPTVAQLANGVSINKSASADSTSRAWTLIADNQTVYLHITVGVSSATTARMPFGFGHFITRKAGDNYNSFVAGLSITNYTSNASNAAPATCSGICTGVTLGATSYTSSNLYVARKYDQTGGSIQCAAFDARVSTPNFNSVNSGCIGEASTANYGGIVYPNGPDSSIEINRVEIIEFTGSVFNKRGFYPGLYAHQHSTVPQSDLETLTGVSGLGGVTLLAVGTSMGHSGGTTRTGILHHDITGPWV